MSSAVYAQLGSEQKVLYLVRHGQTEMNVFLSMNRYDRRVSPRKRKKRCGV